MKHHLNSGQIIFAMVLTCGGAAPSSQVCAALRLPLLGALRLASRLHRGRLESEALCAVPA